MAAFLKDPILVLFFIFVIGACIGSFVNVLIYRIPRAISFVHGTSFCPQCSKRIMPYDLIPILSYIFLRGKCRYCKNIISIKYPLIELISGGLAVLSVWKYGYSWESLCCFFIFIVLLTISVIDMEHMIIPDRLLVSLAVMSIIYVTLLGSYSEISIVSRLLGLVIISLPMYLITLIIKDAFGGGDIKLIAICGFLLGIKLTLLAGFIAVILGGFKGIYIRYIKKDKSTVHIAFGQYICLGAALAMLFGNELLLWYFAQYNLK